MPLGFDSGIEQWNTG